MMSRSFTTPYQRSYSATILMRSRIASDTNGVGVFGLSFYENNTDKLKVATINDVTPSVETVASGGVRMAPLPP